jgi:FAD/FMN-containing dehydrogenase
MTEPSFLSRVIGQPLEAFAGLSHAQRAAAVRESIPDLHFFFDEGRPLAERDAPERTRALAQSLLAALEQEPEGNGPPPQLRERIVTDALLRAEADRDQNVYLGKLFTRTLTRAVPDLIFQPQNLAEVGCALRWARAQGVPVTLRGAASTAMGGAVPNDAGLTLDLSRLDEIEIDAAAGVCVVGAGARLRAIHRRLAERNLALRVYPSNLGGTLAGWFATGGVGLNAYANGRALDSVRAADVVLPAGEHVRLHDDGRVDVPDGAGHRRTLGETGEIAGVVPEPRLRAAHARRFRAQRGRARRAGASHGGDRGAAHARRVPALVRVARARARSGGVDHPLGARALPRARESQAVLGLAHAPRAPRVGGRGRARMARASGRALGRERDAVEAHRRAGGVRRRDRAGSRERRRLPVRGFPDRASARQFASSLSAMPGAPLALGRESVRVAEERFRPQQTKRLGPGMLAAEILMPAAEVRGFLPRAERIARGAGTELDAEVYYIAGGEALVIGGYLTDHRSAAFAVDLGVAPALVSLAMKRHRGRPYVLGRWQAAWFARAFGATRAEQLRAAKRALDPAAIVNRGVLTGFRLRGPLGAAFGFSFGPGIALARALYGSAVFSPLARAIKGLLRGAAGPAFRRGEPARVGARFRARPPEEVDGAGATAGGAGAAAALTPATTPGPGAARIGARAQLRELRRVQLGVPDLRRVEDPAAPDAHARRRGAARRRVDRTDRWSAARSLHALRQLRGGVPGRHPAPAALRAHAAGGGRGAAARPRAPRGGAGGGALVTALPARVPRCAPRRLREARAGVAAGCGALPAAARRERRGPGGDLHPLRRVRRGLPHAGEPRVRRAPTRAGSRPIRCAASAAGRASRCARPTSRTAGRRCA